MAGKDGNGLRLRYFFSREVLGVVTAFAAVTALVALCVGAMRNSGIWALP
ncbi:hypothetical protein [Acidomonas methanolica]|uniref:Uncharacterized protein n=1 Tax=Acidomonas methanolica NBRC 104435 TaxID=1231351 RepID=A0A023D396_ACIMT|nr:hypothetical protein [Acidomonas methanolica]MBU2654858.1 hypothetical protein [Acidomonas methanolica]MCQ9156135.1 hypothetical protein [Acidomonas methanolica]TCS24761.1 hypothetical protein EDC31_12113 [Acidomonas methanolica]GAJ28271.1 hypothetical protein Amme_017_012 [Acidomonas methanolica NBRC 104435]GEK99839.1 hypothetical protein AME01nite_23380 [Acidomonas methanolica NBRC 104435]